MRTNHTSSENADADASAAQNAESLVHRLGRRQEEFTRLVRITERINQGVMLEEILDFLYEQMREVIPYNRIGFSLIDQESGAVVARWARSDRPVSLRTGYRAPLEGSSLKRIIETAQPRIINDLETYLHNKPRSESTELIVREGMRSSLTCPLIVRGKPVGFVFFSSVDKSTYCDAHVEYFQQIAGQLSIIVEKGRLYNDLAEQKAIIQRQNQVLTHELEMARQVQRALIPRKAPNVPGLEIAFLYEPAGQIGGDLLDIIPLSGNRVFLFMGDVMGHGVQAALVMSVVKATLQAAVEADHRPPIVLAAINKTIARLFNDHFVTAACCLVDPRQRRMELALAGHPGPLRFQALEGTVQRTGVAEMPLGVAENSQYDMATATLSPGDALVFVTDGITEAFDRAGNQYGDERLRDQVLRHGGSTAHELCDNIRADLDAHRRDCEANDDMALLVVKFSAAQPENGRMP